MRNKPRPHPGSASERRSPRLPSQPPAAAALCPNLGLSYCAAAMEPSRAGGGPTRSQDGRLKGVPGPPPRGGQTRPREGAAFPSAWPAGEARWAGRAPRSLPQAPSPSVLLPPHRPPTPTPDLLALPPLTRPLSPSLLSISSSPSLNSRDPNHTGKLCRQTPGGCLRPPDPTSLPRSLCPPHPTSLGSQPWQGKGLGL